MLESIIEKIIQIKNSLNKLTFSNRITNALFTEHIYRDRLAAHKNEFARNHARKHFSQTDEDGITLEIIKRISGTKFTEGTFIEFGVGDGCENNTIVLLSIGWRGSWIGGQEIAFDTKDSKSLRFHKKWVDLDNIEDIFNQFSIEWSSEQPYVISLDLDGNDFYLIERLLTIGARPNLFICEYNSILPIGSHWKIKYDKNHRWAGDNYFGASLTSLVELFEVHGYFICACNPQTGANAFFVKKKYKNLFPDIPENVDDIYCTPFWMRDNSFVHKNSGKFIRSLFE